MIIKELFEGPVGDYCIACNTIKCLLILALVFVIINFLNQTFKFELKEIIT